MTNTNNARHGMVLLTARSSPNQLLPDSLAPASTEILRCRIIRFRSFKQPLLLCLHIILLQLRKLSYNPEEWSWYHA